MTQITEKTFDKTAQGETVALYTLKNAGGSEVDVCSYGGTIVSIRVPDRDGKFADVVLGYDDVAGYESRKYFFGAAIGRCGNRISRGRFSLNGKDYQLNCNDGRNHLHGGFKGFDSRVWECEIRKKAQGDALVLRLVSPEGEENYPGRLMVEMTYSFDDDNALSLRYQAVSDADTVCNLTNHTYFNLAGHDSGDILSQKLKINADCFTEVDGESIPTGNTLEVAGTPMDFRDYHAVGERIGADFGQLKNGGGYDHNWVLNKGGEHLSLCAALYDEASGRHMTCLTTSPCVQFYCGNYIDGTQQGKGGAVYRKRGGLCLETQFAPDAVNHPAWASPILRAGERYDETTVYRFEIK